MKTLTKAALGAFIASTSLMAANMEAKAALIGDTVTLDFNNGSFIGSETVVNPGIEFPLITSGNFQRDLDVFADSFDIIYTYNNTSSALFDPRNFILSDLNWLPTPGIITGVTQTAGTTATSISFTDDSITVFLPIVSVSAGSPETFSFDIQTSKDDAATTPEPGTMLGLLTLVGLGLGSRFKGKIG